MYTDQGTRSRKANSTTIPIHFILSSSSAIPIITRSSVGIGTKLSIVRVSDNRVLQRSYLTCVALQGYLPRLVRHYRITACLLASHAASKAPINASSAFLDLFFDVISDLTFGQSFDTQSTMQRSPIVAEFLRKHRAVGFALLTMPLLHLIRNLRISRKRQNSWEGWYDRALQARSKVSQSHSVPLLKFFLTCVDGHSDIRHIHVLVAIGRL
jgi:hypothetical protein